MDTHAAGLGHNNPPIETAPDALAARLAEETAPLKTRAEELLGAEARVPAALDAATVGKAADFVKQIGAAIKVSEDARKKTKQPYLDAGKQVDGHFSQIVDPLAGLKRRMEARIGDHQRRVAEEERRRREEEARRAAEEAAKKEAAVETKDELDEAIEAHAEAAKAQKAAEAPPQELARARGEYGAVATTRTVWMHEVTDATKIPREYLIVNDAAIKAAIKAGVREIAGIRIYEHTEYGKVR